MPSAGVVSPHVRRARLESATDCQQHEAQSLQFLTADVLRRAMIVERSQRQPLRINSNRKTIPFH